MSEDIDQFKVSVLLNGEMARVFHRWSKFYGMAPATLIKHILTIVLRHEVVEIPPSVLEDKPCEVEDLLKALANGDRVDPKAVRQVAAKLKIDPEKLIKLFC